MRVTAFVWGGTDVMPTHLRGTVNSAFIHVSDWYATLTKLVGVNSSDNIHIADGVPPIDGIDQVRLLLTFLTCILNCLSLSPSLLLTSLHFSHFSLSTSGTS